MSIFDDTDNLAGGPNFRYDKPSTKNGLIVEFHHVPTVKTSLSLEGNNESNRHISSATFKAFLTSFKDNFKVNWNQKETFGRMDAIQTYKNTQRQINIGFDVPSFDLQEAQANFLELQKLIQMQYPVYQKIGLNITGNSSGPSKIETSKVVGVDFTGQPQVFDNIILQPSQKKKVSGTNGRFISSPPIIYTRFKNWINSDSSISMTQELNSLLGDVLAVVVSEVNFSPDLEQGFHIDENSSLIPKLFKVELNMTVIHTQELGWIEVFGQNEKVFLFGDPKKPPKGDTRKYEDVSVYPYNTHVITEKKTANSNDVNFGNESDSTGTNQETPGPLAEMFKRNMEETRNMVDRTGVDLAVASPKRDISSDLDLANQRAKSNNERLANTLNPGVDPNSPEALQIKLNNGEISQTEYEMRLEGRLRPF